MELFTDVIANIVVIVVINVRNKIKNVKKRVFLSQK